MSYGFTTRSATKAEAFAKVAAEFDKVVAQQPIHERDEAAMRANANAVIGLLPDEVPPGMEVAVSCNGYISTTGIGADQVATGVSISANAGFLPPKTV